MAKKKQTKKVLNEKPKLNFKPIVGPMSQALYGNKYIAQGLINGSIIQASPLGNVTNNQQPDFMQTLAKAGFTVKDVKNYSLGNDTVKPTKPKKTKNTGVIPLEQRKETAQNKKDDTAYKNKKLEYKKQQDADPLNIRLKKAQAEHLENVNKQAELDNSINKVKYGKIGIVAKGLQLGASIFGSIRRGH